MSRLLHSQINNHNGKLHFCLNCKIAFRTVKALEKHQTLCYNNDHVSVEMPSENTAISFNHPERLVGGPMFIAFDLESMQVKTEPVNMCKREAVGSILPKGCDIKSCIDCNKYKNEVKRNAKKTCTNWILH